MTIPAIEIPSLRPEAGGAPFPGTELPELPVALAEVQRWIDSGEVPLDGRASRWTAWPDRPDFAPIYGPVSLNTGAAGIAWYSLAAADILGGEEHRRRAERAAAFVTDSWRDRAADHFLNIPGTGLAHYGGLAGIGAVLLELADRDPLHRPAAVAVFDEILAQRGLAGGRPEGWTGTDAMLGDGGIVIALLEAAERLGDERYREAAVAAGERILSDERRDADGSSSWHGVDATALGMPEELELDGFELGNVGIAYVLARLAIATGDARYREAAARAADSVTRVAVVAGDAAVFPRTGGSYSFGYCTGSSGVIRSFLEVYRATGDPEQLEWALRFGRGILRSGVPFRKTPGNTEVYHQCCGSAAVLESFVGLWLVAGDRLWLEAARAQGDDLLIRSVSDTAGRRWYSESHVLPTGTLKAEVGHQVGAAGIALALLHLHAVNLAEAGHPVGQLIRLPDDPFPSDVRPA